MKDTKYIPPELETAATPELPLREAQRDILVIGLLKAEASSFGLLIFWRRVNHYMRAMCTGIHYPRASRNGRLGG